MKEISVEGYRVIIEKDEGALIVSVPDLPGCTIQVDKENEVEPRIKRAIGDYLVELASRRPKPIVKARPRPNRDDGPIGKKR